MVTSKEKYKSITDGYFYACSPYCKTILTQGKNGTDNTHSEQHSKQECCLSYIFICRYNAGVDIFHHALK